MPYSPPSRRRARAAAAASRKTKSSQPFSLLEWKRAAEYALNCTPNGTRGRNASRSRRGTREPQGPLGLGPSRTAPTRAMNVGTPYYQRHPARGTKTCKTKNQQTVASSLLAQMRPPGLALAQRPPPSSTMAAVWNSTEPLARKLLRWSWIRTSTAVPAGRHCE